MLLNAQKAGVKITTVDLMLMDYGVAATDANTGATMADLSIRAIKSAEDWLSANGMGAIKITGTLMAGQNDTSSEYTSVADVAKLTSYMATDTRMNGLGFWSESYDVAGVSPLGGDTWAKGAMTTTILSGLAH
jgi:hypothetical protein